MKKIIRYGSVCSGVEAATLAWHPLGWKPIFFSEVEPFPCAVLHERYNATRPINIFDPAEAETEKEKKIRESWNKQNQNLPETGTIPNEGDFTKIGKKYYGKIDLLVGGTPCQDLSVAGKRAGFGGTRSCLALDFVRLAYESGCKWIVWENVPGVFSSRGGGDFATFLSLLSGIEIGIPKKGFASAGFVCNNRRDRFGLAWRVLDAQFTRVSGFPFAVPQRRRRVFVVGYFGDWTRAAKALLEPDRLQWDPPTRIKIREIFAENTGNCLTKTSRTFQVSAGKGRMTDVSCTLDVKCKDGAIRNQTGMAVVCAPVASTLNTHYGDKMGLENQHVNEGYPLFVIENNNTDKPDKPNKQDRQDMLDRMAIAFTANDNGRDICKDISPTIRKGGTTSADGGAIVPAVYSIGNGQTDSANRMQKEVSQTLDCMHDPQAIFFNEKNAVTQYGNIAGTLEARHDSSPCADRGQNIVFCYENHAQDSRITELKKGVSPQLNAKAGTGGNNLPLVQEIKCYDNQTRARNPEDRGDLCGTLQAAIGTGGGNLPLVQEIYPINSMIIGKEAKDGDRQTIGIENNGDPCPTLQTAHHHAVAICENLIGRQDHDGPNGKGVREELAYTQNASGVMGVCTGDFTNTTVRRLTPLECERLMGFPDNYTQIPYKGKTAEDCPDSPRYKACGNSMCVNVMRWIGMRIQKIEEGEN